MQSQNIKYAFLDAKYNGSSKFDGYEESRKKALIDIGFSHAKPAFLNQIHSNKTIFVDNSYNPAEADAMVTNIANIALCIQTADCMPILFMDEDIGTIGAAHAGWRGALSGVIENVVELMRINGARNIQAIIGPSIGWDSFEIGPEVYEQFLSNDSHNKIFAKPSKKHGHIYFNLPAYGEHKLKKLEVSVNNLNIDTYQSQQKYFSYRRNCHHNITNHGNNLSAIAMII